MKKPVHCFTGICIDSHWFLYDRDLRHEIVNHHIVNISWNLTLNLRDCLNLIRVTFGMGDPDELAVCKAGYVLLVRRKDPKTLWRGRRWNLEYSPEMSLSLSYIKLVGWDFHCEVFFGKLSEYFLISKISRNGKSKLCKMK